MNLSGEQIGLGTNAWIWDVDHVDAGHHIEELARNVRRRTDAGGCKIDLARIGLRVSDELWNRVGRNAYVDFHDVGHADDARDRCDALYKIEVEAAVEGGV